MKRKTLALIAIGIFAVGAVGTEYYFLLRPQFSRHIPVVAISGNGGFGWKYPVVRFPTTGPGEEIAYSSIRDPGGIPEGLPVRLKIPAIGVNSAIEDALITPDGRMDVPAGTKNVAWFALGPYPGREGSAVIGGHYGMYQDNRGPTVFYYLDQLKIGDKIYIENDQGDTLVFQVRDIKLFERDTDATTVFTSDDGLSHLNLITCEGLWNKINDSYPLRRVVFTDAIPGEGSVVVNTLAPRPADVAPTTSVAPATVVFSRVFFRSLSVGAQGEDVAALQSILEQKGLLMMPPGVMKGYFGSLTQTAVTRYQASTGLPQVGIFGPMTQARLLSETRGTGEAVASKKPLLPPTAIPAREEPVAPIATSGSVRTSSAISPMVVQTLKSLFATPFDTFVTFLLLISVLFVAFKIIRR